MMTLNFILFMTPLFFSPGPINVIASLSAFKNGIRKTCPFFCGVLIIAGSYALLIGFGASYLFAKFPVITTVIKYVGAAFFLYVSTRFFKIKSGGKSSKNSKDTVTFVDGLIIQSLNPKYPIVLMTIFSAFLDKTASSFGVIKLAIYIELFFVAAIFTWAFAGKFFSTLVKDKDTNTINYIFGGMFVFLAIWLLVKT